MDWLEISARLNLRDSKEQLDSRYYQAFAQLAKTRAQSGNPDVDRLTKENSHLWEENETLTRRLNLQTYKLERKDLEIDQLKAQAQAYEEKVKRMNRKVKELTARLEEKDKLFAMLNDEHYVSQMQLNVLRDRLESLESNVP